MTDIVAPEGLWRNSMIPLGCLEAWRVRDGERVRAGQAVAAVTVEGALHEIVAPQAGSLRLVTPAGWVIAPNTVIGRIAPEANQD